MWNQKKRDLPNTPVNFDQEKKGLSSTGARKPSIWSQTYVSSCILGQKANSWDKQFLNFTQELFQEAHPEQHVFPTEHDVSVIREEVVTAQPHNPYMCDIVKESKIECSKRNMWPSTGGGVVM